MSDRGTLVCRRCSQEKPAELFSKCKTAPCGYERRCKACAKTRAAAYNSRPGIAERQRETDRIRREDPAEREKLRLYSLEYGRTRVSKEKRMWTCAKGRAAERGLPFNIDLSDVIIPATCPLLGLPIVAGKGKLHAQSPSLDRIDSRKGYVKGNVWVISYRANAIKQDASPDELERIAKVLRSIVENPSELF